MKWISSRMHSFSMLVFCFWVTDCAYKRQAHVWATLYKSELGRHVEGSYRTKLSLQATLSVRPRQKSDVRVMSWTECKCRHEGLGGIHFCHLLLPHVGQGKKGGEDGLPPCSCKQGCERVKSCRAGLFLYETRNWVAVIWNWAKCSLHHCVQDHSTGVLSTRGECTIEHLAACCRETVLPNNRLRWREKKKKSSCGKYDP